MSDPEGVVQRQLEAYNARNIDALMAAYAEDAQLFEHPSTLVASGAVALRARFAMRFEEPNLHAHLRNRIVMRNIVLDHELVARTFPEGAGTLECVMIYEVQNGRIAKAWSIAGEKLLEQKI
jgi:hypothetical protein